jgi:hypothetical protein
MPVPFTNGFALPSSAAVAVVPSAWDPANKSSLITLSNSNYTASGDGANTIECLISIDGKATGKSYGEILVTTLAASGNFIGIALSTFSTSANPNTQANVCTLSAAGGIHVGSGTSGTTGSNTEPTYTTGSIVQICYDGGGGNLWFGVNNTYASGANPGTGTNPDIKTLSGTFFMFAGNGAGNATQVFTIQSTLTYAPPAGYTQWGH